ncbi:MAG: hypothetical protein WKF50_06205 [Nocardioides sp.]
MTLIESSALIEPYARTCLRVAVPPDDQEHTDDNRGQPDHQWSLGYDKPGTLPTKLATTITTTRRR